MKLPDPADPAGVLTPRRLPGYQAALHDDSKVETHGNKIKLALGVDLYIYSVYCKDIALLEGLAGLDSLLRNAMR